MRARELPFKECQGRVCNGKPGARDKQYPHFCTKCAQVIRKIDFISMNNMWDEIRASGIPMGKRR